MRLRQCRSAACSRTADCEPRDGADENTRVVDDEPTPAFFHAVELEAGSEHAAERTDMQPLSVTRDSQRHHRTGLPESEEYAAPDRRTSLSLLEGRELSQRATQPVPIASTSPPFHTTIRRNPPIVRHEWRKVAASPDCFFD